MMKYENITPKKPKKNEEETHLLHNTEGFGHSQEL